MSFILDFFTFRFLALTFATAFAVLFVMLLVGIITVEEVVEILNLSERNAEIFNNIITRSQETASKILNIISQLLTKLLGWTGVEVDLSTIKVDVNNEQLPPSNIKE